MGKEECTTRITIDSNLEYSDMTDQLFAHDLVLHRFLSIHNAILEVKYEKCLFPYLQTIIAFTITEFLVMIKDTNVGLWIMGILSLF